MQAHWVVHRADTDMGERWWAYRIPAPGRMADRMIPCDSEAEARAIVDALNRLIRKEAQDE